MRRSFLAALLAAAMLLAAPAPSQAQSGLDPENTVVIELKEGGRVLIELFAEIAPRHVDRIKELTRDGFYDGLTWHRVIDGFMAQTGDPRGDGTGESDLPDLPAEFSAIPFERGIMGMARSNDPDSANSQFFIMFARNQNLDGSYTVVGRVVEGMQFVDRIKKAPTGRASGMVDLPADTIVSMKVLADE